MIREFLLPETNLRESGSGPAINVGESVHRRLSVVLNITRTAPQQSLDLYIWGSPDGTRWTRPLLKVPRQFYCGTWRTELDLSDNLDIRRLRADWRVASWGNRALKPVFTAELMVEEVRAERVMACAG